MLSIPRICRKEDADGKPSFGAKECRGTMWAALGCAMKRASYGIVAACAGRSRQQCDGAIAGTA